jgi:hypothetical protein
MAASVQYWRLPDEEADMVAYLRSTGSIMALPVRRVAKPADLVWKPVEEAMRLPDASFLLTPAEFVSKMQLHHNEQGYAANMTDTPALLYSRGQLVAPQRLSSTALSVEWEDKPADFVRWGKKVMQWVRRVAPGWHKYKHHRITPKADAAREAGMEMIF